MLFMKVSSKFKKTLLGSRLVYSALLSQKWTSPTRTQHKWIMDLYNNKSDQPLWSKAYTLAFKYTKSTRVMEFQLKFLHRGIAINDFLTKIGLENISNCDFWGDGKKRARASFLVLLLEFINITTHFLPALSIN